MQTLHHYREVVWGEMFHRTVPRPGWSGFSQLMQLMRRMRWADGAGVSTGRGGGNGHWQRAESKGVRLEVVEWAMVLRLMRGVRKRGFDDIDDGTGPSSRKNRCEGGARSRRRQRIEARTVAVSTKPPVRSPRWNRFKKTESWDTKSWPNRFLGGRGWASASGDDFVSHDFVSPAGRIQS